MKPLCALGDHRCSDDGAAAYVLTDVEGLTSYLCETHGIEAAHYHQDDLNVHVRRIEAP